MIDVGFAEGSPIVIHGCPTFKNSVLQLTNQTISSNSTLALLTYSKCNTSSGGLKAVVTGLSFPGFCNPLLIIRRYKLFNCICGVWRKGSCSFVYTMCG